MEGTIEQFHDAEKVSYPRAGAPSGHAGNTHRNLEFFFTYKAITVLLKGQIDLVAIII